MYSRKLYHHETDANGVCHFSNYLRLLEECLDEYLCFDLSKHENNLVIASAQVKYLNPIYYSNEFTVSLNTVELHRAWFLINASITGIENITFSKISIKMAEITKDSSMPVAISKKIQDRLARLIIK